MFQECVQADHSADVASDLVTTLGGRKVLLWLRMEKTDNEIAPVKVHLGRFLWEPATEKLWKALHFDLMDIVKGKPACATWQNERPARILLQKAFLESLLTLVH